MEYYRNTRGIEKQNKTHEHIPISDNIMKQFEVKIAIHSVHHI